MKALHESGTQLAEPTRSSSGHGLLSARGEIALAIVAAALLIAAIFLGWRAYYYQEEGDPVASAMLAFEKQNALVVFASRFEVVAESEYEQTVGPLVVRRVRQAAIIPASIDYRLDLSAIDEGDMEWDEEAQLLTVTLPQLRTSEPNLQEAAARIFTDGLLNTGSSQQLLSQSNSRIAREKATAFAKNEEVLALAREAARGAVRQNLAVPLQVAGHEQARVEVRFEGE
ncbi:DUF4230 domain-containing protein [Erythrobacter sp.]|uniref:DUF4230 domain-containing protein n=1 Tax=Erythrobacter sp. TaxID=1042 RepID=UPI002EA9D5EF|nr:DUF4230 domain-containing protein [Erythrobacter sp.]